jgi:hypothetical protein
MTERKLKRAKNLVYNSTSTGINAGGGVGNMGGHSSGLSIISSNSSTSINDSLLSGETIVFLWVFKCLRTEIELSLRQPQPSSPRFDAALK